MIKQVLAVQPTKTLPPIDIPGPFGKLLEENFGPGPVFSQIISSVFQVILIVAGLWALLQFMLAGIAWITSQGDKAALEKARNQIMYAAIGLLIVGASWGLIMIAQAAFGICFGFGCSIDLNEIAPH